MTSGTRQASHTKSASEQLLDLAATYAPSKAHRIRALQKEIHEAMANQVPLTKIAELLRTNNLEISPQYLKKILYRARKRAVMIASKGTSVGNMQLTEKCPRNTSSEWKASLLEPLAVASDEVRNAPHSTAPVSPVAVVRALDQIPTKPRSFADIRSDPVDMSALRRAGREYRKGREGKASK